MASTATLSPCTTLKTPGGSPASAQHSARSTDADGSFSLGLSTTALPQAIAMGVNHIGTMAGKLNGVITAHTPTGCRIEVTSIRVDTFSENPPLCRCGMPQANSTTSRPRATSPPASLRTLPCSEVISRALPGVRRSSAAPEVEQDRGAPARVAERQVAEAALAAATAVVDVRLGGEVDVAADRPVAGSYMSPRRSASPSQGFPPIQWVICLRVTWLSSPRSPR